MLKLKRYLKPYAVMVLVGIVFLFGQAMLELELPNLMSEIVNVGIQQGGITETAPKAIAADSMQLMQSFMTQADREAVQQAYVSIDTAQDKEKQLETYPGLSEGGFVLQTEDTAAVDTAFSRASYALVSVLKSVAPSDGETQSTNTDMSEMMQMIPTLMAALPAQAIDAAVEEAATAQDTLLEQTGAVFVKTFYTQLDADTDAIQTNYILKTGIKMLCLAAILLCCAIGAGFCLARMGAGVARDLRHDVFSRVTTFTNNEMDKFSTASLITRTTNDITQVQQFLSMGLRMMIFAPVMGVGSLVMSLVKCRSMSWILLLAVGIMMAVILILFKVAMPKFKKMQTLVDKLNLVSRENLSGMMVIRAFSTQKFEEERFDKANQDLTKNTLFVNRAMVTMMPVMTLVMNGVSLLVIWVGGHYIEQSVMQVGDMMAFLQYAMHVIMSFLFISMIFVMVPRASVSAERINEVLETESAVKDKTTTKALPEKLKGVVEFKDVSFRYEGAAENVLEHINFTANPGETTAFIGSTGSGKSTLVNLLPRFYDVTEGSITLDGADIRELKQKELRDCIGYVPQKGVLFSGTIESNLRYGDKNASKETMQHAADIAQATEFVSALPEQFAAPISQGGTNVSGGQRQRLSIARALTKKAPIYIFDDTFSALDFKTDAKLRKALNSDMKEATVLIVAQRVSTIMHAQQIIVLDEGRVVGIGKHEDLLQNCATYREIAQSQLSKEELA